MIQITTKSLWLCLPPPIFGIILQVWGITALHFHQFTVKWESKPDAERRFSRVNCILESLRNGSSALKFRSLPRHREQNDESISCPAVFLYFPANICILVRPLRRELAQHFPRGNEAAALRLICSLDPFQFRDGLIFQVQSHVSGTDLQLGFQQFFAPKCVHTIKERRRKTGMRHIPAITGMLEGPFAGVELM